MNELYLLQGSSRIFHLVGFRRVAPLTPQRTSLALEPGLKSEHGTARPPIRSSCSCPRGYTTIAQRADHCMHHWRSHSTAGCSGHARAAETITAGGGWWRVLYICVWVCGCVDFIQHLVVVLGSHVTKIESVCDSSLEQNAGRISHFVLMVEHSVEHIVAGQRKHVKSNFGPL